MIRMPTFESKTHDPDTLEWGVDVVNVNVTYRNGHTALRNTNFRVPVGCIAALVGVNGSGKSTLFKSLMGLVPIGDGQINLMGMSVKQALKNNLVAYVPQAEDVDWSFPVLVEDVVMMGRYGHMNFLRIPSAKDHEKVDQALERVGMLTYRHRQIGELSGGQKKRVFLARALAQNGQVILLDEPFTGVDVTTEDAIITLLRELRDEGKVILVSTHNLGSVPEYCDQTVLISGTVIDYGSTEETFTQANLEYVFGGALRHFVLSGSDLHEDDDGRSLTIISDDERPVVIYDDVTKQRDPAEYEHIAIQDMGVWDEQGREGRDE